MMNLFIIVGLVCIFAVFPPKAEAIVILPAVLLIPIIKIVALVIGSLSVPAVSLSALWSKLFGKPLHLAIAWTIVILLCIGVVLGIILKIHLPERPLL